MSIDFLCRMNQNKFSSLPGTLQKNTNSLYVLSASQSAYSSFAKPITFADYEVESKKSLSVSVARVNAPNSFAHLVPEVSSGSSRFPQTQRDHFVRASLVKCRACNLALKDHGVLHYIKLHDLKSSRKEQRQKPALTLKPVKN